MKRKLEISQIRFKYLNQPLEIKSSSNSPLIQFEKYKHVLYEEDQKYLPICLF